MKKILLSLLLAVLPVIAQAQSYPSPTYNNLTVAGTFTATGKVTAADLAVQAANTVLANVTASSASPTAVAIPSCSTSTSALQYTSGTGFSCGGSGFAALAGASFSGATGLAYSGATFFLNDTSGTGQSAINFDSNGTVRWQMFGQSSTGTNFGLSRFVSGTFTDIPLSIANSTGAVTMVDGITSTPISGSTGSFTTLAASGTVSGSGFSNYLANPPSIGNVTPAQVNSSNGALNGTIGATTPNTGAFTSVSASAAITPSQTAGIVGTTTNNSANAGSVGEYASNTTSGTSVSTNVTFNATSVSLTAGDWDVTGVIQFVPGGSTAMQNPAAGISTTSATLPGFASYTQSIHVNSAGLGDIAAAPVVRVSLASTTTVYLVGVCGLSGGTETANGFIRARRVR